LGEKVPFPHRADCREYIARRRARCEGDDMARKKDRAFFICPRWHELVSAKQSDDATFAKAIHADSGTISKIASQTPVTRSALRHVLAGIRSAREGKLSIDAYIVDKRASAR
jgi:hypothetical protein